MSIAVNPSWHLRRIVKARDKIVGHADRALAARRAYHQAITEATAAGVTVADIARALGVTEARVRQIRDKEK